MKIIPAIDIRGAKCVRLYQGNYARETVYSDNPIDVAQKWEKQGANTLHIVDLDGAKTGNPINTDIIAHLIKKVKIPIQVGGGIRNIFSMYRYIENGVQNIILGTMILENKNEFKNILSKFADKIIVSLDTNGNTLMKKGWKEKSENKLLETINDLENLGVRTIIYTDTMRDGTLTEPNYSMIRFIKKNSKMSLIVAGGVSSIKQIKKLKEMNVDGVILGRALYEEKINLKEAIQLC
jgi:phosphoribosylformimino-5-aminoimidazole carboxamide ribotide isomerase